MPHLRAILALGKIAHDSVLDALRRGSRPIRSSTARNMRSEKSRSSRAITARAKNTDMGVLTEKMFDEAVKRAKIAAMPQI